MTLLDRGAPLKLASTALSYFNSGFLCVFYLYPAVKKLIALSNISHWTQAFPWLSVIGLQSVTHSGLKDLNSKFCSVEGHANVFLLDEVGFHHRIIFSNSLFFFWCGSQIPGWLSVTNCEHCKYFPQCFKILVFVFRLGPRKLIFNGVFLINLKFLKLIYLNIIGVFNTYYSHLIIASFLGLNFSLFLLFSKHHCIFSWQQASLNPSSFEENICVKEWLQLSRVNKMYASSKNPFFDLYLDCTLSLPNHTLTLPNHPNSGVKQDPVLFCARKRICSLVSSSTIKSADLEQVINSGGELSRKRLVQASKYSSSYLVVIAVIRRLSSVVVFDIKYHVGVFLYLMLVSPSLSFYYYWLNKYIFNKEIHLIYKFQERLLGEFFIYEIFPPIIFNGIKGLHVGQQVNELHPPSVKPGQDLMSNFGYQFCRYHQLHREATTSTDSILIFEDFDPILSWAELALFYICRDEMIEYISKIPLPSLSLISIFCLFVFFLWLFTKNLMIFFSSICPCTWCKPKYLVGNFFYSWVFSKASKRAYILSVAEVTLLIQASKLFWVYKQYIKKTGKKKKVTTCELGTTRGQWQYLDHGAHYTFGGFRQLSQHFTALEILWSGWGRRSARFVMWEIENISWCFCQKSTRSYIDQQNKQLLADRRDENPTAWSAKTGPRGSCFAAWISDDLSH
ncbi:hypothetical protein VP01_983g2 [Puccinia sorghi]|uniref:Uncharacterized protein n=1 Tax=Puccinia sorghi TaxID=27349 RepID=A0A0L6U5M9_9BASI|nr:hypothetical protein VP01_983g2 [Puccinia sorghi]